MTRNAERPVRAITPDELQTFKQDGCIVIRDLFDSKWLRRLEDSIDSVVWNPNAKLKQPGFHMKTFMWLWHDGFRQLFLESPLAYWAAQLMESRRVNVFYDQLFVKQSGSEVPTPWHQDLPFWPIAGDKIVSAWISVDAVGPEESGLQYVKKSHLWPQRFRAVTPDYNAYMMDSDLPMPPDFDEVRQKVKEGEYELLAPEVEPGDVLFFCATVLHGSFANNSKSRSRRAVSFRFSGDDGVFDPGHARMMIPFDHGLNPGNAIGGPIFPRILPQPIAEEHEARDESPIYPSPEVMAAFKEQMQKSRHRADIARRPSKP